MKDTKKYGHTAKKCVQTVKNRGFTLLEMLIAVGVLAILLAVAIPGVAAIQRNLEMQELDDVSRQIFLASQAELVDMKSSGELEQFKKDLERTYTDQNLGRLLDGKPVDYGDADTNWQDLYYLYSSDQVVKDYLVDDNSVLRSYLEGGSFVLELNPRTGDLYSVFYTKSGSVSYEGEIQLLLDRSREMRRENRLGYYGGQAGSSAGSTLPREFLPEVKVVNEEDLYLQIICSNLGAIARTQRYLTMTVLVEDEHGGSWTKELKGGVDFSVKAFGDTSCDLLLDSLRDGEHFKDLTRGALKAGDNLSITATMDYAYRDVTITGYGNALVNSLFGEKKEVDGATEISVGTLRHLNNLRGAFFSAVPSGKIQIVQTRDISFAADKWSDESVFPGKDKKNPLTVFAAIDNKDLLQGRAANTSYDGRGTQLREIPFGPAKGGSSNAGLFSTTANVSFQGVRLVDCAANSGVSSKAGLLVGEMLGGTVSDCQAYLTNTDEYGRFWEDMEERLSKYSVNVGAGSQAGGLIGVASGTVYIEDSFAAAPVKGGTAIGGLVGAFETGSIQNSYGSGDITAVSYAGGLAGSINDTVRVENCYSTSDVVAASYAGGLVGRTTGGRCTFLNSNSYGKVSNASGGNAGNSAPFVGSQAAANSYTNCAFLQQGTYNANYDLPAYYAKAQGFTNLKSEVSNAPENSHPYNRDVFGNGFPFLMLTGKDGRLIDHYGNWMAELKLQTSLVYYERYADGSYGYYAKTSLTTAEGGSVDGGSNVWTVDTLKKGDGVYCVEDGYALMTIYKLSKFTYQLENGSTQTVTTVDSVDNAGDGKSPLITNNVSLIFRKDGLTHTISNARVYQLPFNLQVAERGTVNRFFLKLKISGYVGSGAEAIFKDFSFYYCPDFAKNAVNPDPGSLNPAYPTDPGGESNPIYVRSPRQLNGLSRYTYYWNEGNNGGQKFYFKQEIDLNYGEYVKKYCGKTYNLMDTGSNNAYRNKPIGRPTQQVGSQFRNIYDGGDNTIVDYRCVTYAQDNYQFTGLFGEVRRCTLKNIHMIASNPGEEGEASSGYVESRYETSALHGGTGALVGLVYVAPGEDSYDTTTARVSNCSVSGYDVIAQGSGSGPSVLGGLVGYNFGYIENSSAVSKSIQMTQGGNTTRYVGGLVGSLNGKGGIANCYAGGVLKVKVSGSANVGGLVSGYDGIYGYGNGDGNRAQRVSGSYSYCTWTTANLPKGTFYAVTPLTDRFTVSNCYYLSDTVSGISFSSSGLSGKVTVKNFSELSKLALSGFGKVGAGNSFPWSDGYTRGYPFPAIVKNAEGDFVHYGDWYDQNVSRDSAFLTYYEQYKDNDGKTSWGYSYVDGKGDVVNSGIQGNEAAIVGAGYGVLQLQGKALPTINGAPAKVKDKPAVSAVMSAASGVDYDLRPFQDDFVSDLQAGTETDKSLTFAYVATDEEGDMARTKTLYLNTNFAAAISSKELTAVASQPLQIRTEQQLQNMTAGKTGAGWYFKLTHSVTATFSTGGLLNGGYHFDGGYAAGGRKVDYAGYTVGESGNYLLGLQKPLFAQISGGSVRNLALLDVKVGTGRDAAALALSNGGAVENCFAQGEVLSTGGHGAGLILQNSGTIRRSYFNGTVVGEKSAAGLVSAGGAGRIEDCYVMGEVRSGDGDAAGFLLKSVGGATVNCYTLAEVWGDENEYGFAPAGNGFIKCYWGQDKNFNTGLAGGAGEVKKLSELAKLEMGEAWEKDEDGSQTYPLNDKLGKARYPSLKVVNHYGDWPVSSKSGKIGVAALYRSRGYYYLSGCILNLSDDTAETVSGTGSKDTRTILVLLPDERKQDEFVVTVTNLYDNETVRSMNRYGNTLQNLEQGVQAYQVQDVDLRNTAKVTIEDREDGETYSFIPVGNGWRFQKTT